ncbi:hypothetical protein EEB13_17600 [Rhodococcus sp. WS3]|nr:hypothetical protein EEB13_17600 [Rhodococcus sp. WS3]
MRIQQVSSNSASKPEICAAKTANYDHLIDNEFYPEVFNIGNIGTPIDLNGQIDRYELYLELFDDSITQIAR